jgi:SpoVK/Ycf46/Vps4 family AAA+-type ATPase
MISAVRSRDGDHFSTLVGQLIAGEAAANHHDVAERLRRADEVRPRFEPLRQPSLFNQKDAPEGVQVLTPSRGLDTLTLAENTRSKIERVLREHRHVEKLTEHGLRPARSALFQGPTGNGKTTAALALARELGRPAWLIRWEDVVDSYLGATAAKLSKVFKAVLAQEDPLVLVLDELDTVGTSRAEGLSKGSADGELRRVVNTLFRHLDDLIECAVPHLVVATTNFEVALDSALVRRFETRVEFPGPDAEAMLTFARSCVPRGLPVERPSRQTYLQDVVSDCTCYAECEVAVRSWAKDVVCESEVRATLEREQTTEKKNKA